MTNPSDDQTFPPEANAQTPPSSGPAPGQQLDAAESQFADAFEEASPLEDLTVGSAAGTSTADTPAADSSAADSSATDVGNVTSDDASALEFLSPPSPAAATSQTADDESLPIAPSFMVPTSPNLSRTKTDRVDALPPSAEPMVPVTPLRREAVERASGGVGDSLSVESKGKRKKLLAALAGVVVLGGGGAVAAVMLMPPSKGNVGPDKTGPIVPPAPPKSSEAIASLLQQKADELKRLQPNTKEFESSHFARASRELDSGALNAEDRQKLLGWMRATQAELDGSYAGAIVSLLVEQYGGAAASNAGASWAPRNSTVGAIPSSLLAATPISGRAGLMNLLTVAWLQPGDGTAPAPAAVDPNELKREAAKWLKKNSSTPAVWASKLEQFEIERLRAELQREVAALKAEVGAVRTTAMNAEKQAGDADTKATTANEALTAIGELKRADLEAAFASLDARKKLDEFKPESLGDEIGEAIRAEFKAIWDDADGAAKALQAKVDDATEAWASKDAAPIREQLQRLQAGLVQLQLRRVTLAAAGPKSAPWSIDPLKKLGSGLHARFVKLKEQEQAVDKELAELKKLADEMAGKTVAPDEGAALLARMQELLQVATQLELELAAKKQVPSMVKLAYGKQRFDAIAALVDLKPEAIDALKPAVDASEELKKLWDEYKKTADEWRTAPPAGPLTPEDDAKLAARLESAVYAKLRLETAKSLADIATAGAQPPNAGQPGQPVPANAVLRPEYQRTVKAINDELTKLQTAIGSTNAALAEQTKSRDALAKSVVDVDKKVGVVEKSVGDVVVSMEKVGKSVAQVDQRVEQLAVKVDSADDSARQAASQSSSVAKDLKALTGRVDQLVLKPDGVSQAQIAQITSQSTKDVLAQLAEWGYVPQPGNGPPPGTPPGGAVDPSSARETAAQGYSQFYVGETEHLHRALKLFGHACQQDPTHPTYRYFLGLTLFRLGRVSEAEAQIRTGRGLERNREHLHVNGDLQRVQGPMREWFENVRFGG